VDEYIEEYSVEELEDIEEGEEDFVEDDM